MLGKFWRAFCGKLVVFVQGKLCSISKCSVVLFMIGFLSFISKIKCTALPCLFFVISFRCCWEEFPQWYRSCLLTQGNKSRLALCLVLIALKAKVLSQACTTYLTSISLSVLLFSQNNSHWEIVLHYCWLSLAASMGTPIKEYQSRNDCHKNFVKARNAFSCVQGRFWNMMLMFYSHAFHLQTLKDVVGHYKLWNEVMLWFTQMICYNVYIPLLIRPDMSRNAG